MLRRGVSIADFLLSAAAAARGNDTAIPPAVGASSVLPDVNTWRTGARQPIIIEQRDGRAKPFYLQIKYATREGAKSKDYKTATSTSCGFEPGAFATRAAAVLAKADFKEYVDSGMNPGKRTGGAGGHSTKRPLDSDNTTLPKRFSLRFSLTPPKALLNLTVRATGVSAALSTGTVIDLPALQGQWKDKSRNFREPRAASRSSCRSRACASLRAGRAPTAAPTKALATACPARSLTWRG
jgi:hypothetical protein